MKPGFYTIMAAQFFSSLSDNALLIAAIALLMHANSPDWMSPLLKLFFAFSYVILAPFVGSFADALPKGRVMLITNTIKIAGCLLMFFGIHPLISYAIVGFGAAAYSPAKYGILTELLPHERLVAANGWIEGLTVLSIILGTVLGGVLIMPTTAKFLLNLNIPGINFSFSSAAQAAVLVIIFGYVVAALFNLKIPNTGVIYAPQPLHPVKTTKRFLGNVVLLWQDKIGQISLGVTTLFWGAGATLQFIIIQWAASALGMGLDQAAILQGVCAFGVAAGAIAAAKLISLKKAMRVLPMGILLGAGMLLLVPITDKTSANLLIICVGAISGFFVVPMNALLQHRGHVLLSAGRSIAIQNFNENFSVLGMLTIFAVLISFDVHINTVIILFGLFIVGSMALVILRHRYTQSRYNIEALIGEEQPIGIKNSN